MLRIDFAGALADFAPGAGFYDAAALHDCDTIAEVAHQRHGVRDEETSEAVTLLQVAEQVDDLCADRDVEGADGFVEDEELGAQCEGAGDVDALALAAGELMGIAWECGGVEADFSEKFVEARFDILFEAAAALRGALAVDGEGFGEGLADGHAGVESGVGILEDDGELAA